MTPFGIGVEILFAVTGAASQEYGAEAPRNFSPWSDQMKKADMTLASRGNRTSSQESGRRVFHWLLAIFSLGLLLPARAGAGDAAYHFFPFIPKLSLSPSGALPRVAQSTEPETPPPQPPITAPEPPPPPQPPTTEPEAPLPQAPTTELEPPPPQPPVSPEAERPKPEAPREALLLEVGAILLPKGTLQLQPGFEFTYLSSNRVAISGLTIFNAIIIGLIEVDSLRRDILTGSLTTRYGLLDRLQLDVKIPYVYRKDEEILGVGTTDVRERTTSNNSLGDIDASLLWQALIGRGAVPDVILRVDGTFPTGEDPFEIPLEPVRPGERRLTKPATGTGFYGVGPGITAVWRSDPVIFSTGFKYTFNLPRNVGGDFGEIDPGDTIEWLVGLTLAVSERVAINLSFVDKLIGSTTQNGREIPGSSFNDARLVLGTSIGLSSDITLLASVAIGLTTASPDFQFTVSLPIVFKLF